MPLREHWMIYALGSALFAALTAVFGKLGVAGIPSNLATFIRTVVVLGVTAAIIAWRSEWRVPGGIEAPASAPVAIRQDLPPWTYVVGGPGGPFSAQRSSRSRRPPRGGTPSSSPPACHSRHRR